MFVFMYYWCFGRVRIFLLLLYACLKPLLKGICVDNEKESSFFPVLEYIYCFFIPFHKVLLTYRAVIHS